MYAIRSYYASVHNLKTLKRSIYVEDRVKAFNENIYYNINAIQQALSDNKKITFKYFQYTAAKKKQYKNNGLPYRVSPYHIVWQNDNYYLVCYCEKHNNISRYRIDRMLNVCVGEEKRKPVSVDEILLVDNLCSTFGMYGGERKEVVLKLHNDLVNVIIDRYGKDVYMRKEDNEHFIAFVEVQISPPFWGWLFQFGDKAQIISPEDVVNEAKDYIRKLEGIYKK